MSLSRILAIWKPKGPTSHDVVDAVRRITGERRVGHAGTLDPMAEGVLVIGIGREATKRLREITDTEKEYIATTQFGATSSTDDAEGEITPVSSLRGAKSDEAIPRDTIEETLKQFIGRIEQVPPAYSAVKVRGQPAHRRMRRGEEIELKPRIVEIKQIKLLEYAPPPTPPLKEGEGRGGTLTLHVVCGPGTYIRALARDIGRVLGVGGYLTALERTRVGAFTKADALTIEQFRERWPQIAASR